jgi:hypothetical protein
MTSAVARKWPEPCVGRGARSVRRMPHQTNRADRSTDTLFVVWQRPPLNIGRHVPNLTIASRIAAWMSRGVPVEPPKRTAQRRRAQERRAAGLVHLAQFLTHRGPVECGVFDVRMPLIATGIANVAEGPSRAITRLCMMAALLGFTGRCTPHSSRPATPVRLFTVPRSRSWRGRYDRRCPENSRPEGKGTRDASRERCRPCRALS